MLAGGALAVAGLVACNSAEADPDPEPEPPTGPGTTVTEPDPTEPDDEVDDGGPDDEPPGQQEYEHPEPGEDIDDEGQAGAEAAAVYFVELYSYIYATGDFGAWDEITTNDCSFCTGVRERVAGVYATGGYATAHPPELETLAVHVWDSTPGDYSVDVSFVSPELEIVDAEGGVVESFGEERTRVWILTEWRAGEWTVLGVEGDEVE